MDLAQNYLKKAVWLDCCAIQTKSETETGHGDKLYAFELYQQGL